MAHPSITFTHPRIVDAARATFLERFGVAPAAVALAPGRVNLIGEHTDYNDGFVLPIAIDRYVAVAWRRRDDDRLRAWAEAWRECREGPWAGSGPVSRTGSWFDYVAGTLWALALAGMAPTGLDLAIVADLPSGAGLSSSAALELAVARAALAAAGLPWDAVAAARRCQRAENDYVGVACGIMDQCVVACARAGHALRLDCRSLAIEHVPIGHDVDVVVLDTGVRRRLLAGEYNQRRAACERAVAGLRALHPGLRALRDVTPAMLAEGEPRLDAEAFRRARHVVEEIGRPGAMGEALRRGDLAAAGALMNASHASLRDLYEVSSPALDAMVDDARSHAACFGARLTGAGFGGCAVALVAADATADFVDHVTARARHRDGDGPRVFAVRAVEGVRLVG